jgi:hypothetical protein
MVYVNGVGLGGGVFCTTIRSSGVWLGLGVDVRKGVKSAVGGVDGVRSGVQAVEHKKSQVRTTGMKRDRLIQRLDRRQELP